MVHGLFDNSVRPIYLILCIIWLRFCHALNLYHPLNGVSLGTSVGTCTSQQNCRFKNKNVMIAHDDVFAMWVYKFREINTIPNPPEKFRKQVIKASSIREGW